MIDVAVVGAGPGGLSCAARLASEGFDVGVFEEHAEVGVPTHCTGVVSPELSEFFKLPDHVILNRLTAARLVSPTGYAAEILWDHSDREEIFVVDRRAMDAELARTATQAGAVVHFGARVESLTVGRTCVEIGLRGMPEVRARACVLAAGVAYAFHRQLGLGLPARLLHSAQLEVAAEPQAAVELHLGREVAPEGFLWMVPIHRPGGTALKIGAMARGNALGYLRRFLARPEVVARLKADPPRPVLRLLPLAPVARTFGDRLLVVGDAAGLVKPTTAGGIYYSVLSAALAAEVLVPCLRRDDLGGRALAAYEALWRSRLSRELRVGVWIRDCWSRFDDRDIDTMVRALGSREVLKLLKSAARFNWHSPLIFRLLRQEGIRGLVARSFIR
jgi:geranylgeranyl reductase family protein